MFTGENVAIVLFFIGLASMVRSRRMFKTIISISIMEVSVVLFFLTIFAQPDFVAPIGASGANVSDPLPQALMITAIVIGASVTAISLVMLIDLYHKYGTSDWEKARKIRMENKK